MFNPFQKRLDKIQLQDLARLRTVSEGWYVEYKGQLVPPKKIAKSISSFANQYGGWLFYGIQEGDPPERFPEAFPGLETKDAAGAVEALQRAVSAHVEPKPYYETRVLTGPNEDLGLGVDRSIVMVRVPPGKSPPYIHSSGCIYRRTGDASDPQPETTRLGLDELWERRRQARRRVRRFFASVPRLAPEQKENSLLLLHMMPKPYVAKQTLDLDLKGFAEAVRWKGFPFDSVFEQSGGFVARQLSGKHGTFQVPTFRQYLDGRAVCTIPLRSHRAADADCLRDYQQERPFLELLQKCGMSDAWILDMNLAPHFLMCGLRAYLRIARGRLRGPLYVRATLANVWRRVPFVDTPGFMRHVASEGVPIALDPRVCWPRHPFFWVIDDELLEAQTADDATPSKAKGEPAPGEAKPTTPPDDATPEPTAGAKEKGDEPPGDTAAEDEGEEPIHPEAFFSAMKLGRNLGAACGVPDAAFEDYQEWTAATLRRSAWIHRGRPSGETPGEAWPGEAEIPRDSLRKYR